MQENATKTPCVSKQQKKRKSALASNTSLNVSLLNEMETAGLDSSGLVAAVMSPLSEHTKGGHDAVMEHGEQPGNRNKRRSLRADDLLSGKEDCSRKNAGFKN